LKFANWTIRTQIGVFSGSSAGQQMQFNFFVN
jgi:hypothetical protein